MKLINPSVELIQQQPSLVGIYKHIEKCARTCYKSEDKITEDSYKKMYNNLVQRNHLAMLEHGTIYLYFEINPDNYAKSFDYPSGNFTEHYNWTDVVGRIYAKYDSNPYSKVNNTFTKDNKFIRKVYITTNLRVIIENHWEDDLEFICEPTEFHERRITLKFITNIGVTREANRHRTFPQPEEFSVAEESTRYCNYTSNKFGNEITFIKPIWISWKELQCTPNKCHFHRVDLYYPDNPALNAYINSLVVAEEHYNALINDGWSPQQAREVLPLATKSEVVYTAFASDWKHWFGLRLFGTTGKPHPNMEEIARLAQQELIKNNLWNLIYPENERN
jgi:thymidylate synthase (FAD)